MTNGTLYRKYLGLDYIDVSSVACRHACFDSIGCGVHYSNL